MPPDASLPPDVLARHLAGLPHGPAFRFIDRLTTLDPGRSAAALYRPTGAEAFFSGHFPGHPIVPGVLLVEAIAQLAGIVAQSDGEHPPLTDLRLAAVRQARIHAASGPGEELSIEANVTGRLGALVQATGSVSRDGALIAEAQVTLSGRDDATARDQSPNP